MEPERSTVALVAQANRVCRLNGPPIGRQTPSWKLDPLVVLGARESRARGEAAEQAEKLSRGNIPYAQK